MDIEAVAGAGWGLAIGLLVALIVSLAALRALWRRAKGDPPPHENTDVKFPDFGGKRAA